jgi:hypothetical protein
MCDYPMFKWSSFLCTDLKQLNAIINFKIKGYYFCVVLREVK